MPLTNLQISQAKPDLVNKKEYKLTDGDGMQLRVRPNGTKTWIFNYTRPLIKKRATISFGSFPEVTLIQARKLRIEARELLAQNIDPKTERDQKLLLAKNTIENTFEKYALLWKELKSQVVQQSTISRAYNSIQRHILPSIGKMPIADIRTIHVKPLMAPLLAQDKRETIKRLCMFINEIMRHAVAEGAIEFNPLSEMTSLFPAAQVEHRKTIKPEELPELMSAVVNANITKITRCMFELQLHCMTRPSETSTAKWEEFDLDIKIWTIPAEKMKMRRAHQIPLSTHTVELLKIIKTFNNNKPYLFPSVKDPLSHANSSTVNMALKRMGFQGRLVAHGLRALASTTLNEQGFNSDLIETALAHVDKNTVRKAYNRSEYIEKRRAMMQWWSEHIHTASHGDMSMVGGVIKS